MGIKHKRHIALPDTTDPNVVQTSDWNEEHEVDGMLGALNDLPAEPGAIPYINESGVGALAQLSAIASSLQAQEILDAISDANAPPPWVQPDPITTVAGEAIEIMPAGIARKGLMIANESGYDGVRLRWDGIGDASENSGFLLGPGLAVVFGPGEVPASRISAYSSKPVQLNISYC